MSMSSVAQLTANLGMELNHRSPLFEVIAIPRDPYFDPMTIRGGPWTMYAIKEHVLPHIPEGFVVEIREV